MKNRKGFTVVEVITVISLLSILLLLVFPNVIKMADNSKRTLKRSKVNTMIVSAEKYGNDHINQYQLCDSRYTVDQLKENCVLEINNLISYGYLTADTEDKIVNPETGLAFNGNLLLCYDKYKIEIHAKYIEDNNYSCS